MDWHFHDTGSRDGATNMTIDDALARGRIDREHSCALRVYGWCPRGLSLGWNQSDQDIDFEKASSAGVDVVRRPTGGRAILHSQELTYSVVLITDPVSISSVYQLVSRALLAGLRLFGVNAEFERSQPHFPSVYRSHHSSLCFVSTARHEITVAGKKIVGSAQRRYARPDGKEVVLQHGSILMGPDHLSVLDYLRFPDDAAREEARKNLSSRTTDLSAVLGRVVGFSEVAASLRRGFEQTWNVEMRSGDTTEFLDLPPADAFKVNRSVLVEENRL